MARPMAGTCELVMAPTTLASGGMPRPAAPQTYMGNVTVWPLVKLVMTKSSNDNEKASVEIQKAMEVWPQNPKLAEFDKLVEAGGGMAVAKNDFDRLLSEQNYREIFRRQYEIAPAIAGDTAALAQADATLDDVERVLFIVPDRAE